MQSKRIYVASSWRNEHQPTIVQTLRGLGFEVYDFREPQTGGPPGAPPSGFGWQQVDREWSPTAPDALCRYRDMLKHPIALDGFAADFNAMKWADTCVLVMPSGRSAHIEAGWMAGQGKRLIVYHPPADTWNFEPELMYLVGGDADAVIAISMKEVLDALTVPPRIPPDAEQLYYIRDVRSNVGNCASWWRPKGAGYTCDIGEAGRYTEAEAKSICGSRNTDVAYRCEDVEAHVWRHVRFDVRLHPQAVTWETP